jgi:hypothetical protein
MAINIDGDIKSPGAVKDAIRERIKASAGDYPTLIGATSDAAAITMYSVGAILNALKTGSSIDDLIQSDEMVGGCLGFFEKVNDGDLILPCKVKTVANSLNDITKYSAAVSSALINKG